MISRSTQSARNDGRAGALQIAANHVGSFLRRAAA